MSIVNLLGRTGSWDDNTTGSHSSNWDDKNNVMGNLTGNASSSSSWDAQTPNAWQQQQKNKQIMGSATGMSNSAGWPDDPSDWNASWLVQFTLLMDNNGLKKIHHLKIYHAMYL